MKNIYYSRWQLLALPRAPWPLSILAEKDTATTNFPSLEIELNEAWVWSEAGELSYDFCPKPTFGKGWKVIDKKNHLAVWTQYLPNGKKRVESTWRYWTTPREGKRDLAGPPITKVRRHQRRRQITEYKKSGQDLYQSCPLRFSYDV